VDYFVTRHRKLANVLATASHVDSRTNPVDSVLLGLHRVDDSRSRVLADHNDATPLAS